jgi:hypothetical protein
VGAQGFWGRGNPIPCTERFLQLLSRGVASGPFSTTFLKRLKLRPLKLFPNEVIYTIAETD